MSRRYPMRKKFLEISGQSKIASLLEIAVYLTLCMQIASTAIYYNTYIEPLVHKMLLGQTLALAAWFFYFLYSIAAGQLVLRNSPYYIPLLVFCAWAGIRAYTAPNTDAVMNYWIFLNFVCAFPLWVTCFRNRLFRSLFAWTVVFCGAVITFGCARQLLTKNPGFYWDFFPAITLSTGKYDRQWLGSFMGHNNDSTDYIAIAMLFAGALWSRHRKKTISLVLGAFILIGLIFVILGGSRGVTLMLAAALIFLVAGWRFRSTGKGFSLKIPQFVLNQRRKLSGFGAIVVVVFAIVVLLAIYKTGSESVKERKIQNVWARFLTPPEHMISGTYPRCWLMSLLMARDNPLAGVGFSSWPYRYPDYQKFWFGKYPDTRIGLPLIGVHSLQAHNDFLQTWAELGGIGLILFLWLIWTHFRAIVRIGRTPAIPAVGLFAAAATVATLTRAFAAFPFHMAAASCLFIANVGLVSSLVHNREWVWRPAGFEQKGYQAKGAAALVVAIVAGILFYPIWVLIVADYSARFHGRKTEEAQIYLANNDITNYQKSLDLGYQYLTYSLEWIPNQGQYMHELGAEALNRGLYNRDEKTLLQAVDYQKRAQECYGFYRTHECLGMAYRGLWEITQKPDYLEKAIAEYRETVAIMPTCMTGWVQLGLLLAKSGRSQECLELLADTELRFPGLIEQHVLGAAKTEKDTADKALLFDLAAVVKPGSEAVLREVALFYLDLKRMDRAISAFTHMAPFQSKETVVNWMNTLLITQMQNGLIADSFDMMRQLLARPELHSIQEIGYYSGIVHWIGGNAWEAAADWGIALKNGVALDQLEPPASIALSHLLAPLNLR